MEGGVVLVTGAPRSGTTGIAALAELVGAESNHQPFVGSTTTAGDHMVHSYSLVDSATSTIPGKERDSAASMCRFIPEVGPALVSSWDACRHIYLISQLREDVKWVILVRDIEEQVNSLHNYRTRITKGAQSLQYYANLWLRMYQFIYEQAEMMDVKPLIMRSEAYFAGDHNVDILNLLGIDVTDDLLGRMKEFLVSPYNRRGIYEMNRLDSRTVDHANILIDKLENL